MSGLTVFSVVRNGIRNGYPFVEAYASWLEYSDRVYVLEGASDDGTPAVLAELAAIDGRFTFETEQWPARSTTGSSIASFTDLARSRAAEHASRLMYVQADEVYTREQRLTIRNWADGGVEFARYINFWNSLETVLDNEFQTTYVRHFSADAEARSIGDGFSFDVPGATVTRLDEPILHYGWCFPVNILEKHIGHGSLYADQRPYVLRAWLARRMLERRIFDRRLLDALVPAYRPVPFEGEHPECMRHLVGADVYNPYVALDLLRAGARW